MTRNMKHIYPMTAAVIAVTSVVTMLQFVYPEVLEALRRDPSALQDGEWWRVITPLFVHADGLRQFIINIICIGIIGAAAERFYGKFEFLILYFAGGLAGEIAGYAWDPYGAGASVGFCGLLGGLFIMFLSKEMTFNPLYAMFSLYITAGLVGYASGNIYIAIGLFAIVAMLMGIILKGNKTKWLYIISGAGGLLGGAVLLLLRDIHGAATLAGDGAALIIVSMHRVMR